MGNITVRWNDNHMETFAGIWWLTTQEGLRRLTILNEEDDKRYEIPLENVRYWGADADAVGVAAPNPKLLFDRYCDSCKTYFDSGQFHGHPIATHDVRRTCCGASPQHDHHPSCTQGYAKGYKRIGTITDITEDDNGLSFSATFDPSNPASPFFGLPSE